MREFVLIIAASLWVSAPAAAEPRVVTIQGTSFDASLKLAREIPFVIPAELEPHQFAPRRHHQQQVLSYSRGGYTFESGARTARDEAERNLRESGIAVLSSRVYKEENYPWNHGFVIEYFENNDPYRHERFVIETYTGGTQSFESNSREEMNRTVQNLRAAGYRIILGQVIKQAGYPWNYFYTIDYLRSIGRRPPHDRPGVQVYRSGGYRDEIRAQIEMNVMVAAFRSQGKEIISARLLKSPQSREWRFEIHYREERRHDDHDRGHGRDRDRDHGFPY